MLVVVFTIVYEGVWWWKTSKRLFVKLNLEESTLYLEEGVDGAYHFAPSEANEYIRDVLGDNGYMLPV